LKKKIKQIEEKIDEKTGKKVMVSKESGHLVERLSEVNYLFRLSHFKDKLKEYLSKSVIIPSDKYKNVLLDSIGNMKDLSVSRESKRVSWGIQVPNDSSQIIYVWLDALVNYLTVAGYPDNTDKMNKLWPPDCHICGKDIIKFHAIYWPAFLFAANLEPPKNILCHGHFLMDGKKMSKSLGNVIDPFDFQKKYTTDGIRYILIRDGIPDTDNNINFNSILNTINSDLSNTIGNLFQRCAGEGINRNGVYPCFIEIEACLNEEDKKLIEKLNCLRTDCDGLYENFNFYKVTHKIMDLMRDLNLLVQESKPWILAKDEKKLNELNKLFFLTFESLRISSILLNPIVPNLTNKLLDYLNTGDNLRNYENAIVDVKRTKVKYIISNSNRNVLFKRLA
jgi:methionyl-tRNA synthetase